jgi:hypothetical protein
MEEHLDEATDLRRCMLMTVCSSSDAMPHSWFAIYAQIEEM